MRQAGPGRPLLRRLPGLPELIISSAAATLAAALKLAYQANPLSSASSRGSITLS